MTWVPLLEASTFGNTGSSRDSVRASALGSGLWALGYWPNGGLAKACTRVGIQEP